MEYIGLIFEFVFLIAGIYGYLFSIGKFKSKDLEIQKKADDFRARNGNWMRIGSLLLMALMTVNIVLHLRDLFA